MALYKRDDSPFFWMCLTTHGRLPRRVSTKIPHDAPTATERLALEKSAHRLYLKRQAEYQLERASDAKPPITVAKFLDWYEEHVSRHNRGADRERSILRQFTEDVGALQLAALTRDRLIEWRTGRLNRVVASTVNRELDVLKAALTLAVPTYLDASPADGLPRLRGYKALPMRILTRDEESRLLNVLEGPDQALVICGIDTLIRAGDLLDLEWSDDHRTYLHVRHPKDDDAYDAPVSTRLRAALDRLPKSGRYIFGHRRPKTGTRPIEIWRMLRDGCLRIGVLYGRKAGGFSPHGLRHTGASRLMDAGVDPRTIMAIGDWKSIRQLARYAHPDRARFGEAVDRIGAGVPFTPDARTPVTAGQD